MTEHILALVGAMTKRPPATRTAIEKVETALGINFPAEYRDLLLITNGAIGPIGPLWHLHLWAIDKLVEENRDMGIDIYTPEFVFFGDDGGNEGFAFDKRYPGLPIVEVDRCALGEDTAEPCGETFCEFLETLAART